MKAILVALLAILLCTAEVYIIMAYAPFLYLGLNISSVLIGLLAYVKYGANGED